MKIQCILHAHSIHFKVQKRVITQENIFFFYFFYFQKYLKLQKLQTLFRLMNM